MANTFEQILQNMNKKKLEQLKHKIEQGEISDLLQNVDKSKAEQLLARFGLAEQTKGVDLNDLLERVKQNPELLEQLKKKL